eukprot:230114-Chlamydomonas_euryale.AAC.6
MPPRPRAPRRAPGAAALQAAPRPARSRAASRHLLRDASTGVLSGGVAGEAHERLLVGQGFGSPWRSVRRGFGSPRGAAMGRLPVGGRTCGRQRCAHARRSRLPSLLALALAAWLFGGARAQAAADARPPTAAPAARLIPGSALARLALPDRDGSPMYTCMAHPLHAPAWLHGPVDARPHGPQPTRVCRLDLVACGGLGNASLAGRQPGGPLPEATCRGSAEALMAALCPGGAGAAPRLLASWQRDGQRGEWRDVLADARGGVEGGGGGGRGGAAQAEAGMPPGAVLLAVVHTPGAAVYTSGAVVR